MELRRVEMLMPELDTADKLIRNGCNLIRDMQDEIVALRAEKMALIDKLKEVYDKQAELVYNEERFREQIEALKARCQPATDRLTDDVTAGMRDITPMADAKRPMEVE